MKKPNHHAKLIAAVAALVMLGAIQAQAIIVNWRPVGITLGQTARVTADNTGTTAIIISGGKFLDSDGNVLAEFERQVIDPGKMISFDLNADDIIRESNRIEIRGDLTADTSRGLLTSIEVFENDTGKTTVFIAGGK